MKSKYSLISSLLMLTLFAVACGSRISDSQTSLIEALRGAGADVEVGGKVEQDFFKVEGLLIKVNGLDVQVFEYETAEALESDSAQIAPDGGSIGTSMVGWLATPHFYKAGHLLVLFVGDDPATLELLEGALGAQFAG